MNGCGILLYLTSTCTILAMNHIQTTRLKLEESSLSIYDTPPRLKSDITRCDSDFSLGLGRNDSISRELNELGPMCRSGQLAFQMAKVVTVSFVSVLVLMKISARR